MNKYIKILFITIILNTFLIINFSGCWGERELKELKIAIGLGVDKSDYNDKILLTAQIVKPSGTVNPNSNNIVNTTSNSFFNITSEGTSIFEAIRNVSKTMGFKVYVSHTQVIIFGKKVAIDGLEKYDDFFFRANEIRPNTLILISTDTAIDILNVQTEMEKITGVQIANIIKGYGFTSTYKKVFIQNFENDLMSKTNAPIAPLISIKYSEGIKNIYVSGMAVFKKSKMIGSLDEIESRGLLWVNGEVKSGVITVNEPSNDKKIIFEILKEKSILTPKLVDGKVIMDLKIKEASSIVEQTTTNDINSSSSQLILEKEQSELIRKEVMKAFEKSKALNADIFGFGEKIRKKYPKQWKEIGNSWEEIYPKIQLTVNVESKIIHSNKIIRPASNEGSEDNGHR